MKQNILYLQIGDRQLLEPADSLSLSKSTFSVTLIGSVLFYNMQKTFNSYFITLFCCKFRQADIFNSQANDQNVQ